ncbi:ABC transporter ATP-binding protein [Advenella sp. RU8]|uniref:ABC transporter ATP-binding protein n=1 Tax=Advenella sp. RU8 TaxID=3399575 RepID=UPI003AADBDE2
MKNIFALEVNGLNKVVEDANGQLRILEDISFSLEKGKTLAITGSSGSGKSTLLGILAGLDVPSQGTVHLMGQDLFMLDEDQRAQLRAYHVGFVFQSFQLLPNLTALENVMLPLELQGKRAREAAWVMLERVGLAGRSHHYPKTLSGGERQRVALARAFVVEPAILFADEPTGSLDATTGANIMDLMFALHQEKRSTLVLVTHDATLASRCQQQLVLQAGRIQSTSPSA